MYISNLMCNFLVKLIIGFMGFGIEIYPSNLNRTQINSSICLLY